MQLTQVSSNNGVAHVAVQGDVSNISPTAADPLVAALGAEVYAGKLMIDLGSASYLDSSGIGWLIACQKRSREAGGKIALLQPPPLVLNVLKVANLHHFFQIAATADEARQFFARESPTS